MRDDIKNILGVSLALAALVFALSFAVLANAFLKGKVPVRTFMVSAEGEVVAVPDIAEFNFAVISEGGQNLVALQQENSAKSNQVTAYLKEQGVSQEDIKTTTYDISPRYQNFPCTPAVLQTYPEIIRPCPPSEIVGYTITHSVLVKVHELAKVGQLLGGVVDSGANSASQIFFSIDNLEAVQSQAREMAIQKAKEKAQNIADAAGVRLGPIVSINESFFTPFAARELSTDLSFGGAVAPAPPTIEPGSQEVKVNVSLVFEIR